MMHALLTWGLLAEAVGVFTHRTVFIHGDWDKHAAKLASVLVTSLGMLVIFTIQGSQNALSLGIVTLLGFYTGLFLSIIVYRGLFHPLRIFPGPWLARATAFWAVNHAVIQLKWHTTVQELHRQYGDFVRISMIQSSCALDLIC
jgi:hypothetical protein